MLSSPALRPPPAIPSAASVRLAVARHVAAAAAARRPRVVVVAKFRDYDSIPKGEPFTPRRSILDEFLEEKPLLERTKDKLTDYCTTLEGDPCCSCWEAYFELQQLEKELPRAELERMAREYEGRMRDLISSIHHRTYLRKLVAKKAQTSTNTVPVSPPEQPAARALKPFPVPDELPKTEQELAEEAAALMPDSPYTRLLRRMGTYPAWYTPRPDHETD